LIEQNGNIYNLKQGTKPQKPRNKYGKCECGHGFVKRTNRATKEVFLGCAGYPKCKKTKSLKVL
jgi:ssDNA-binding Zn-finger/Zn-ribbon topoisomerase 1